MSVFDWLFGRTSASAPPPEPQAASAPPDPAFRVRNIQVQHHARAHVAGGDVYIRVVDVLDLLNKIRSSWGPFSMVFPSAITDFASTWLRTWAADAEAAYEKAARDGAHAATDGGLDVDESGGAEFIEDDGDDEIDREIAEIEREVEAARAIAERAAGDGSTDA